jgi:hypothetical protein
MTHLALSQALGSFGITSAELVHGMTRRQAREIIARHDPVRALRADAVDPLPLPAPPCTCPEENKIEVHEFASPVPELLCTGRCQT